MRTALVLGGVLGLGACDVVFGLDGRGTSNLDDGLVAHYAMDSAADLVEDSSGNELHGMCRDQRCPTISDGKVGGGLHFDGTVAVVVNPDPRLETMDAFTIAGWYRVELTPALEIECAFNKVALAAANSWQTCFSGGNVVFITSPGMGDQSLPGGSIGNAYQHIALWWDGDEKRVYVDGLVTGNMAATTTFTNGAVVIGADYDNSTVAVGFTGDMDDLRIYDRPLSLDEITALVRLGD